MKNIELSVGVIVGAAIACAVMSRCGKESDCCEKPDRRERTGDDISPPLCRDCRAWFPCDCFPPKIKPPKKKDPCKGCYYEKYERKSCK